MKKREYLGGCEDLAKMLGVKQVCCGSCHSDEEEGYSDIGDWLVEDGYYGCCCGMREAAEKAGHKESAL